MNPFLGVFLGVLLPQQQPPATKPAPVQPAPSATEARVGNVQFDANGWPIVADTPQRAMPTAPLGETASPPTAKRPAAAANAEAPVPADSNPADAGSQRVVAAALASGMELGSPLLEVFQFVRSPGAFKALAGQTIWWRITIFGGQGEKIGVRELTHTADCAFAERDRVEYEDQRIYGRSGATVFAEKQGMPWPTLAEAAGHELSLFGLHLRMPWCFGDGMSYMVVSRGAVDRADERLARIVLERRLSSSLEVVGPEIDPRPRDRYELIYEPSTGTPREFVHRFASSGQTRRVLLEDWREVEGVRMPHRRVYVDETMRQTTTLELLRIERASVSDRDFRLH